MKKVNLYETYRKVKQRERNRKSIDLQKLNAEKATYAAKQILENPTLNTVKNLRKFENQWLMNSQSSLSIADEFETAIRANNFEISPTYSSYETGYKPKFGILYCFASDDYPGIVKIGATTYSIEKRLYDYQNRRKLQHLKVVIALETTNPSRKEKEIHDILHSKKVYPETIPKSNEWFRVTQKKAKEMILQYA